MQMKNAMYRTTSPLHVVACFSIKQAVPIKGSFFDNELNYFFQPFLSVKAEFFHTLHEDLKFLRAEFIEDASESLNLNRILFMCPTLSCLGPWVYFNKLKLIKSTIFFSKC